MKLPTWLRRQRQDSPKPELKSPVELYEASGKSLRDAPRRTQDILREAERNHQRRTTASDALHAHEVSPADAALMRMMAGAKFGPDAAVTLPSGKTITGTEMARWVEQQGT